MSQGYVSWEPEPSRRGTYGIILSCFTTLGICVWSALHLSIPRVKPNWVKSIAAKLLWLSIGLLLPEMLIYAATGQRLNAAKLRDEVNKHDSFASIPLKPKRASLLSATSSEKAGTDVEQSHTERTATLTHIGLQSRNMETMAGRQHRWTLVHGFYALMGGFVYYGPDKYGNISRRVVSSDGIKKLLKYKPELIPDISEDEIRDKSKADSLAKAVLFIQVGWFCINCISRLIQHLPLTLLEVSTLAHALCSMSVYILWWNKPLNVQEPTVIPDPRLYRMDDRTGNMVEIEMTIVEDFGGIPHSSIAGVWIVVGLLYGVPHLSAWNATFPTHTEQLLWRLASCLVAGTPAFLFAFILLLSLVNGMADELNASWLTTILIMVSPVVYFPASLYLIGASLRQLFHLPPDSFLLPVWSNYFPHFS